MAKEDFKKNKADTDDGWVPVSKLLDIALTYIPEKKGLSKIANAVKRLTYGNFDSRTKKQHKTIKLSLDELCIDSELNIEICENAVKTLIKWGVVKSDVLFPCHKDDRFNFGIETNFNNWWFRGFKADEVKKRFEKERVIYANKDKNDGPKMPTPRRLNAVKSVLEKAVGWLGLHPHFAPLFNAQVRLIDALAAPEQMRQALVDYVLHSNTLMTHLGFPPQTVVLPPRGDKEAKKYRNWIISRIEPADIKGGSKSAYPAFDRTLAGLAQISVQDAEMDYLRALAYDLIWLQALHGVPNEAMRSGEHKNESLLEFFKVAPEELMTNKRTSRDCHAHLAKVLGGPHTPEPVNTEDLDSIVMDADVSLPLMQLPNNKSSSRSYVTRLRAPKKPDVRCPGCAEVSKDLAPAANAAEYYLGTIPNTTDELRQEGLKKLQTCLPYTISTKPQILVGGLTKGDQGLLNSDPNFTKLSCSFCLTFFRLNKNFTCFFEHFTYLAALEADYRALNKEEKNIRMYVLSWFEDTSTRWKRLRVTYPRETQSVLSETLWSGVESLTGSFGLELEQGSTSPFERRSLGVLPRALPAGGALGGIKPAPLAEKPTRPAPEKAPEKIIPEKKVEFGFDFAAFTRGFGLKQFLAPKEPKKIHVRVLSGDDEKRYYEHQRAAIADLGLPPPIVEPEPPPVAFPKALLAPSYLTTKAVLEAKIPDPNISYELPPPDVELEPPNEDTPFEGPSDVACGFLNRIRAQTSNWYPEAASEALNAKERLLSLRTLNFNPIVVTGIRHDQEDYGLNKDEEDLHAGMVRCLIDTFPEPPRSDTIQAFFDRDTIDKFINTYGHLSFYNGKAANKIYDIWLEGWKVHLKSVNQLFDGHSPSEVKAKYTELYFTPDLKLRNENGTVDTFCRQLYKAFEKKSKFDAKKAPFSQIEPVNIAAVHKEMDAKRQDSYSVKDLLTYESDDLMSTRAETRLKKTKSGKPDVSDIDKKLLQRTTNLQFLVDVVSGDYEQIFVTAQRIEFFTKLFAGKITPSHFEAVVDFFTVLRTGNPYELPKEYRLDKLPIMANEMAVRGAIRAIKAHQDRE